MNLQFHFTYCFFIILILLPLSSSYASDVKIQNVRLVNRTELGQQPYVLFDLSWNNAWNNEKNHDAIWVFTKFNDYPWAHPKLNGDGHKILKNRIVDCPVPVIKTSDDSVGVWIHIDGSYRGDVDVKVKVMLDTSTQKIEWRQSKDFKVFAIEMVYIPEGPFDIGDPSSDSDKFATFYMSDEKGKRKSTYKVSNEDQIEIGPEKNKLFYWSESILYNGDQKGPLPLEFPKGTKSFYIMKYELTQGQYADFLSQQPEGWSQIRNPIGGKNYYDKKGTIYLKDGRYRAKSPNRPMNYVSFLDGLAYSDWSGLRPITELEYEKASRGPGTPVAGESVWGVPNYYNLERYVDRNGDTGFSNGIKEEHLSDLNRDVYGCSYYWVMDLSGSLWEKVITIGNPAGRAFQGSHGDGILEFGNATNIDWPKSDDEQGGFGYRGGGYYAIGTEYSDYNPHSPIGYRYYGAWSGGPRSIAYGYRAGRTANQD